MSPSWVYPKPTGGTVPIVLGNWGALGVDHAARYADEWMPIDAMLKGADGRPDVAAGVDRFRRLVAEHGRDPDSVPVSPLMFSRPNDSRIERYAALGIRRVVLSVPSADVLPGSEIRRDLDEITPVVQPAPHGVSGDHLTPATAARRTDRSRAAGRRCGPARG